MNELTKWGMIYLINSAWQIPVLALSAAGLVKVTARGGAKLHYQIWLGCLGLALVLPAIPGIGLGSGPGFGGRAGAVRIEMVGGPVRRVSAGERVAAYAREALQFVQEGKAGELLLGLYGLSVIAGSVRLARRLWVTRAVVRGARPMKLPPVLSSSLLRSAEALGVEPVGVYCSAGLRCPATVSWPKAMLLVPADFGSVAEVDAAAAIGHELAHVRRRDFEVNLLLEAVSVMAFYHPALHWIARQVAESREVLCDEMAAEATLGRTAYAKSLLSLAESAAVSDGTVMQPMPSFLLGVLEGNTLERRIMKLIDGRLPLSRRYRVISVAGCWVFLGVVSVGVVALSVRPSTAHAASSNWKAPTSTIPQLKTPDLAASKVSTLTLKPNPAKPTLVADAPPPPEMGNGALRHIGGDVLPPVPIYTVDPEFSEQARAAKFMGVVTVGLIVDEDGMPQNVHVVRGVGMGLDEKAVDAVSRYKFPQAMENGQPVSVQLNIEVNFQIF